MLAERVAVLQVPACRNLVLGEPVLPDRRVEADHHPSRWSFAQDRCSADADAPRASPSTIASKLHPSDRSDERRDSGRRRSARAPAGTGSPSRPAASPVASPRMLRLSISSTSAQATDHAIGRGCGSDGEAGPLFRFDQLGDRGCRAACAARIAGSPPDADHGSASGPRPQPHRRPRASRRTRTGLNASCAETHRALNSSARRFASAARAAHLGVSVVDRGEKFARDWLSAVDRHAQNCARTAGPSAQRRRAPRR